MSVQVFVEGIADKKFLEDYLKYLDVSNTIVSEMGGKDEVLATRPDFERNFKKGTRNLLILDADASFVLRLEEIKKLDLIKEFEIDLFLFPNHLDNGDLEILLENIISPANSTIFDCWNSYEDCLRSKVNIHSPNHTFTTPARKTKIYAYLEALLGESKKQKELIKERERDYLNKDHWNLDSEYLTPLKEFLS